MANTSAIVGHFFIYLLCRLHNIVSIEPSPAAFLAPIDALRSQGVVPDVSGLLHQSRDEVANSLQQTVLDEVAAYSESSNPEVLPELAAHLRDLGGPVISLLSGERVPDLGFVRAHAERRAAQRFPLEALLHTYRCAHKVIYPWARDAAIESAADSAHIRRVVAAVADLAIEYADLISTIATSYYVNRTRRLAEAESEQRAELLNMLLSGYDESDSRAAHVLRRAGYLEQRQSYCVVTARSVNPEEMQNVARAQRMVDAITGVLARAPLKVTAGIRDNLVFAIVSGTRRLSGWTAPQSLLADRLIPHLRLVGPAALIGLSNDVPATSHIPRAAAEANLALDFASVAERVKPYAAISLRQLLLAHARNGMQSALPTWIDEYSRADQKSRGRLTDTLRAYADADMNVLRAAKELAVHPNTIYARAQRIDDITGKNPLSYHDLTELLLATDCREPT
jgi:sugar diacid utilization regulator